MVGMSTPIHERICHFCFQKNKLLIDDEYHLIMKCEQVNDIRSMTIILYTNFATFLDLMKTSNIYKLE